MSYFNTRSFGEVDACADASACSCSSCRGKLSGFGQRYVRDEDEEPRPGALAGWGFGRAGLTGLHRFAGYGDTVTATDERTNAECRAEERRIRAIVEPPAADLVNVERRYLANPGTKRQLLRAAYDAYVKLKAAAEADGVPAHLLTIVSGYRNVARQRQLWADALKKYGSPRAARKWVAPPGGSPHHTGRAIDFWLGTKNSSGNITALRATGAYRWLVCNAMRFGFFPYAAEPWHWEFNPADATAPTLQGFSQPRRVPQGQRPTRPPQEIAPGPLIACAGKVFATLDEFHFDKANLRKDARRDHFAQVDAIAKEVVLRWQASRPVPTICLQGHADLIGNENYNLDLGERRARAVKDELCRRLVRRALLERRPDIPGKVTITVTTFGESAPVAPGSSPAARARNRRVDVYLLKDQLPGDRCRQPESRSKDCERHDILSASICENADKICKIAGELKGDEASRKKCEEARRSCAESEEISRRCK